MGSSGGGGRQQWKKKITGVMWRMESLPCRSGGARWGDGSQGRLTMNGERDVAKK